MSLLPACPIFRTVPVAALRRGPRLSRYIAYLPAAVWAAVVLTIGGLQNVPQTKSDLPLDKVAHFGMYGILGALAAWGWLRAGRTPAAWLPLMLSMLVGIGDELHQGTTQTRSPEVADAIADIAGAAVGFVLVVRRSSAFITGKQ